MLVCASGVSAQWQKKDYKQWSEKEALKVLNDSPWGQTQNSAGTERLLDASDIAGVNRRRDIDEQQVEFRIRFFSSKPIRQATSRLMELMQKGNVPAQFAAQLDALAKADFSDYVVITVVTEAVQSGSLTGSAASLLARQNTTLLKSDTYLVTKEGKRVFLLEFQPPRRDGLGARFIFPRLVDGKPFITPDSEEVLFHSKLVGGPELNMRFKTKNMIFDGKLEY